MSGTTTCIELRFVRTMTGVAAALEEPLDVLDAPVEAPDEPPAAPSVRRWRIHPRCSRSCRRARRFRRAGRRDGFADFAGPAAIVPSSGA